MVEENLSCEESPEENKEIYLNFSYLTPKTHTVVMFLVLDIERIL
jgi:hypothetical protein